MWLRIRDWVELLVALAFALLAWGVLFWWFLGQALAR